MSKFVISLCLTLALVLQGCSDDSGTPSPTHSDATVDAVDVVDSAVDVSEVTVEDVTTDATETHCGDASMDASVPGC